MYLHTEYIYTASQYYIYAYLYLDNHSIYKTHAIAHMFIVVIKLYKLVYIYQHKLALFVFGFV